MCSFPPFTSQAQTTERLMPLFYDKKEKLERNRDSTVYIGGMHERVTKRLLWELFIQVGPVVDVNMPKDRITGVHQGYGFVEFANEVDADYAIKILNMIKVYGKPIRLNKASSAVAPQQLAPPPQMVLMPMSMQPILKFTSLGDEEMMGEMPPPSPPPPPPPPPPSSS